MMTTVTALEGENVELSDDVLSELASKLAGDISTPAASGYPNARIPFNAMHSDRPGLVIRCRGTVDVIEAVNFAREKGIEVTVRGGGHSIAGLSSTDGGMVIDLSFMRGVAVDPQAKVAHVQGGAILADVDRETQAFGLATPTGAVSQTGVAGLTLGGGYGWLRRKYGLACDNVVSAPVVCADGRRRTASAGEDPDLLWGIRGGGGNFGIVTTFTFRLHAVGPVLAFAGVFYPIADTAELLREFREYFEGAPDEVTPEVIAITMPADPHLPPAVHDQQTLIVAAVHCGSSDEGMRAIQPLRELGTPLADISQPMPFTFVQSAFDAFFPSGRLQSYWKSTYLEKLSDDAIDAIASRAQERPAVKAPLDSFYLDLLPMGGAVGRVHPEDTAFSARTSPYLLAVDGNWTDPGSNSGNISWVRETWGEMDSRFGEGSTYLNFSGSAAEHPDARPEDAFAQNLRRLVELKAVYDPDNFFRRNNNILPAT